MSLFTKAASALLLASSNFRPVYAASPFTPAQPVFDPETRDKSWEPICLREEVDEAASRASVTFLNPKDQPSTQLRSYHSWATAASGVLAVASVAHRCLKNRSDRQDLEKTLDNWVANCPNETDRPSYMNAKCSILNFANGRHEPEEAHKKSCFQAPDELDLRNCNLQNIPDIFAHRSFPRQQLKTLRLSDNNLTELPESLARCTSIKMIDLSGNPLKVLPAAVGRMESLRELNLSQTCLFDVTLVSRPDSEYIDPNQIAPKDTIPDSENGKRCFENLETVWNLLNQQSEISVVSSAPGENSSERIQVTNFNKLKRLDWETERNNFLTGKEMTYWVYHLN